jgi:hypothetical protein
MDRKELQQAVLEAQAQIQAQAQAALAERMTALCIKRCVTAPTCVAGRARGARSGRRAPRRTRMRPHLNTRVTFSPTAFAPHHTRRRDKLSDRQRRCLDMCTASFVEGFGVAVSAAALSATA